MLYMIYSLFIHFELVSNTGLSVFIEVLLTYLLSPVVLFIQVERFLNLYLFESKLMPESFFAISVFSEKNSNNICMKTLSLFMDMYNSK